MFDRNERLRELFRCEIIKALREVKDPGLAGFLTITDLKLSVAAPLFDTHHATTRCAAVALPTSAATSSRVQYWPYSAWLGDDTFAQPASSS